MRRHLAPADPLRESRRRLIVAKPVGFLGRRTRYPSGSRGDGQLRDKLCGLMMLAYGTSPRVPSARVSCSVAIAMESNMIRPSNLIVLALMNSALLLGSAVHADETKASTSSAQASDATPLSDQLAAEFNRAADAALRDMKQEAEKRKMNGAAVVALIPGAKASAWTSRMQAVGSIVVNKSNVLGVAYTKAAEMADTLAEQRRRFASAVQRGVWLQGRRDRKTPLRLSARRLQRR